MSSSKEYNPLVTVLVPFYNDEKYANKCINSILAQKHKNIEVILVDDDSTDNTYKILKEFERKDKRIKVIHRENGGVSAARNTALDVATGDFVCLVDQDDEIDPDFVSYYLGIIGDSEIALTPQPYKFNDDNRTEKKDVREDVVYVCSGEEAAEKMLYYKFVIAPWNKLISRELIEKNKIRFHEELFGGEGFMFSVECFLAAKKVTVGARKVYNYRVDNSNSGMTKFSTRIVESSMLAQRQLRKLISEKASNILKACRYANWHTATDCYNMMIGCRVTKKFPEMYRKLKKICRRDAPAGFTAPIKMKEKMKNFGYFISPGLSARVINRLRLRKFTVEESST